MSITRIYNDIVGVTEKVKTGDLVLWNSRLEIERLSKEASELGIVIDVEALMYEIEKDMKARNDSFAVIVEEDEDEFDSSYEDSYESSFESSY